MGRWPSGTRTPTSPSSPRRSPPSGRDRANLIVLSGLNVGEMFRLGAADVVIGRGQGSRDPGGRRRSVTAACHRTQHGGRDLDRGRRIAERHLRERRAHHAPPAHRRRQGADRRGDRPQVHLHRRHRGDVPAPDVRVGAARPADARVQQALFPRPARERVPLRAPAHACRCRSSSWTSTTSSW